MMKRLVIAFGLATVGCGGGGGSGGGEGETPAPVVDTIGADLSLAPIQNPIPGTFSGKQSPVIVDPSRFPWRTQMSLAIDPTDDDVVYVGVEHEGYFKTTDGGVTWSRIDHGIGSRPRMGGGAPVFSEFYSTSISTSHPNILYTSLAASPGTVAEYSSSKEGVYRSTDGGATWLQAVTPTMNTAIYTVAVDPTNPAIVYAGCNGNVASTPNGDPTQYFNAVGSIYKSLDGGGTWTELNTNFTPGLCVNYIEIAPSNPAIIYASAFVVVKVPGQSSTYPENQYGVLKSTDGGASWMSKTNGMDMSAPGRRALRRLAVSPRDPNRLFVCTLQSSMYYSNDGGDSFQTPGIGYTPVFAFDPHDTEGDRLIAIDGTAVWMSENGGASFSLWGTLPAETQDSPTQRALVQLSDVEWSREHASVLYMSGSYGRVYKSIDGGVSWTNVLSSNTLP